MSGSGNTQFSGYERALDNPDFQAGMIRLGIWLVAFIYIGTAAYRGYYPVDLNHYTLLFFLFFLVFSGILVSVYIRPEWALRRYVTLVIDISAASFCIYLAQDSTSPFYLIYIWIFISYGTRYGEKYLKASAFLSVMAYTGVLVYQNQFREQGFEIALIYLLLTVLPFYQYVLLRKLHKACREAEMSSQAKTRFLAKMTRQLRSPLNGILGITQLMEKGNLDSDQRAYLKTVSSAADTLRSRIGDALDLSRIETGTLTLDNHEFETRTLVQEVCDGMTVPALEKGLEMICSIDPDVPLTIHSDFNRLKQILFNLVENAVNSSETGLIEIKLSVMWHTISTYLRIDIIDTGKGVPEEIVAEVFANKYSKAKMQSLNASSVGLGLTIVYQLSKLMSIDISVAKNAGGGSCVSLAIPLGQRTQLASKVPMPDLEGLTGFVFERNLRVLGQIEALLSERGVSYRSASHVAQLATEVSLLERRRVDFAIIADAPDRPQDMYRIADIVRDHLGQDVPVIFLGFSGREIGRSYLHSRFMGKPVFMDVLARNIKRMVESGDSPRDDDPKHAVSRIRVLVAEDNRISGMILSTLLADLGHEVYWAKDGQEALDAAGASRFDLAIIDVRMPRMDGLVFTQHYRRDEGDGAHMPIIALTAHDNEELRQQCFMVGMDEFLLKPVDRQVLSAVIQQHLQR